MTVAEKLRQEVRREVAKAMLLDNINEEQIKKYTKLSTEELEELKRSINHDSST